MHIAVVPDLVMITASTNARRQNPQSYQSTDGGSLFRSRDRGETWEQLPVNLGSVAVGALAIGVG